MYTIPMIIDQLNPSLLIIKKIIPGDNISSVRISKGGKPQNNTLYLAPAKKEGCTNCFTSEGSSFSIVSDLGSALNRLLEILDYFSSWEKEMQKASRSGCTLTELLDLAYSVITYPLIILDNNEWMIACSSVLRTDERYQNNDIVNMLQYRSSSPEKIAEFNQNFHDCFTRKDVYKIPGGVFTDTGYAMNLFHNRQFSGILLIDSFSGPISQGKLDLFYLLGTQIQEMLNDPVSGLSIATEEPSVLTYLRFPNKENEEILRRDLKIAFWKEEDEKQLIFIAPCAQKGLSPNLGHAMIMFNRLFGLVATAFQNGILLFLNLRLLREQGDYNAILQRIQQLSYCAGISNPFTNIGQLPVMAQRAYLAYQSGPQESGSLNYFEDHYLRYFYSRIQEADKELLNHPLMDQLKKYDRRYGSSLFETLFVYLKNERRITQCAKEMQLSRSTLLHRIERIEQLSGGVLNNPNTRMHILLSYYLEYYSQDSYPGKSGLRGD